MPTIKSYDYPNTTDKKKWSIYLGHPLNEEEEEIIDDVINEKKFNKRILDLYKFAQTKNLHIPILTNLHGDCIFESLRFFKLCNNILSFRQAISFILLTHKHQKYFIPNQELTLNELFQFRNEIPYVYCTITKKLYVYNYDTMCIDLGTLSSWTRMDTQIILTVISIICNLKIIILHDNQHITEICTNENEHTHTIHLGLIREVHYIPLDYMEPNKTYQCPRYLTSTLAFITWAKQMALAMGRVTYESSSDENSESDEKEIEKKERYHKKQKNKKDYSTDDNSDDDKSNHKTKQMNKYKHAIKKTSKIRGRKRT